MADSTDPTKPYRHFESNFTPDKFEEVFYWAKPILDYDKSSDFGKWYVRSIYANIAVQVKLCHDHKEANDDKEYLYAWSQLIKFWDALTRHEQYKDIDKGCFAAKMSSAKRR
ncbi:uncharacterized protein N7515_005576 [Penicillium bovifimosum]|uniref:Uncharacterized protein n=1 Tax=Penicillium bovifimosum TaxID=126998 RepID=A0A9W9GT49_9EURO|nr:uncharacterized protein N7515_005576 [Penicillium bovifimosum]KAJ5129537.1 hypothetical protein N7515_005576 [Penicillium bovifimosum]